MSEVVSVNGKTGVVVLTAPNVEAVPESEAGQPSGVATLDSGGHLPETQLPSSAAQVSPAVTAESINTHLGTYTHGTAPFASSVNPALLEVGAKLNSSGGAALVRVISCRRTARSF